MIEKTTIRRMLELFFAYPTRTFHLRELSRELGLSMPTVLSTVRRLKKDGLVIVKRSRPLAQISANTDLLLFARLKRIYNLESLYLSGLVDFLYKEYRRPRAIICFGSYSRGDDTEKSDVDIAIITDLPKELDLSKFEKRLGRNISIHIINLKRISTEFKANLCNGIALEGAL